MERIPTVWTGWISFGGWLMVIIGAIDFFEGLIAVIRSEYYLLTPSQIIVFDTTAWGWIMMIWGIILLIAGFSLLSGQGWARWFTIVAGGLNFLIQLGFVGSSRYPLWAVTSLALTGVVIYALAVHWHDSKPEVVV